MSVIWRENVTCLFLKMNPLKLIQFCWSGLFIFFSRVPNHWKFEAFLVTVWREGPLLWSTCWPHPVSRTFSSGVFPYCLYCWAYGWMRVWNGFDVDSRWGTFCVAGELLEAMQQPRSSVRRHTGRTRTYGHILYTRGVGGRGAPVFHKAGDWAARSGYARSYRVSSTLQPRSEHTSQVGSVENIVFIRVYRTINDSIFCAGPWNNNIDIQHTDPC